MDESINPKSGIRNDGALFWNRQVVQTADGSHSIFLPDLNEHYHSTHGAVQESKHVFMRMGWSELPRDLQHVNILEVGFGTGLNAWLVCDAVNLSADVPVVHYTSLEAFPVSMDDAKQLNYTSPEKRQRFLQLHEAAWNAPVAIHDRFRLEKLHTTLQEFVPQRKYDLVFFDAFAPRVQPEMWTKEIFEKLFTAMNPGGILVTYCSKGEVRRNMIAAGLNVEKVPGPPGKREMLRAKK